MRRIASFVAAISLLSVTAMPAAAAADFPQEHACEVVQSLPFDIIGHLLDVSPATAARLIALLSETCAG
jgi:hypothetical protein